MLGSDHIKYFNKMSHFTVIYCDVLLQISQPDWARNSQQYINDTGHVTLGVSRYRNYDDMGYSICIGLDLMAIRYIAI